MQTIPTHLFQLSLEDAASFIKDCVHQSLDQVFPSNYRVPPDSLVSTKEEPPISVSDVCELLHISRPTCGAWMKSGKIPYRRMGRRIFFFRQEVIKSLESFN